MTKSSAIPNESAEYQGTLAALRRSAAPLAIHAATVDCGADRILLVGEHGAGKTTLALALRSLGNVVRGDDVVLIDFPNVARALPRPVRIKAPSTALVKAFSPELLSRAIADEGHGYHRLDLTELGGPAKPVDVVVFTRYRPGCIASLQHQGSDDAMASLMNNSFDVKDRTVASLEVAVEVVRRGTCCLFEYGGEPVAGAKFLLEALVR